MGLSSSSTQNEKHEPNIFKLNNDCLEQNFDYLSLENLITVCKTCKRLHHAVGEFFQNNFFIKVVSEFGNIYSENIRINCLSQFVRSIVIGDGDLDILKPNRFNSLEKIDFHFGTLNSIENAKLILPNVKSLKFTFCKLDTDVHDTFLMLCKKLKRLYVRDINSRGAQRNIFIGISNDWLAKKYSTLEHVEVHSHRMVNEVIHFLQINPNIRKFSTTIEFLIANRDSLLTSNITLNTLAILHAKTIIDTLMFSSFVNQLTKLQQCELFQHLNLYFHITIRAYIYPSHLLSVVTIYDITNEKHKFALSSLVNLKQLYLLDAFEISDLNDALFNLKKLNYIRFYYESIDHILIFIKTLPKLRTIQINFFKSESFTSDFDYVLNITAINSVRKQLTNAGNLTIYVKERVYLATKSALKQTKCGLIEIKRYASDDGFQDFATK